MTFKMNLMGQVASVGIIFGKAATESAHWFIAALFLIR